MQHEALLNHISERGETKGLEIGIGSLWQQKKRAGLVVWGSLSPPHVKPDHFVTGLYWDCGRRPLISHWIIRRTERVMTTSPTDVCPGTAQRSWAGDGCLVQFGLEMREGLCYAKRLSSSLSVDGEAYLRLYYYSALSDGLQWSNDWLRLHGQRATLHCMITKVNTCARNLPRHTPWTTPRRKLAWVVCWQCEPK